MRNDDRLESSSRKLEQLLIADQLREGSDLHHPTRAVIVLRFALIDTVLTGRHPCQIVLEPLRDRAEFSHRKSVRVFQDFDRASNFHQMNGVDNSDAAA